jgi:hypothetical protein
MQYLDTLRVRSHLRGNIKAAAAHMWKFLDEDVPTVRGVNVFFRKLFNLCRQKGRIRCEIASIKYADSVVCIVAAPVIVFFFLVRLGRFVEHATRAGCVESQHYLNIDYKMIMNYHFRTRHSGI